jgi:hypothetical protein
MLKADRDALLCDLAETYGVYSFESLPTNTVAILACGLRANSRIKMKFAGVHDGAPDILLLGHIADRLGLLVWQKTKDGQKGRKRPPSFVEELTGKADKEKKTVITVSAFETPEEFERARLAIIKKVRARNG